MLEWYPGEIYTYSRGIGCHYSSWILDIGESIKFIKRIHDLATTVNHAVNTSVIQFTQEKFAQEVMQLLDKYDPPLNA